jgi:hypothetical protein
MGPYNEFAIMKDFDENEDYGFKMAREFEYEKLKYVSIEDDYVGKWSLVLKDMLTYFHTYSRAEKGFARYGVTLIPPTSLKEFYDCVINDEDFNDKEELEKLSKMIQKAIIDSKFIVHFGI